MATLGVKPVANHSIFNKIETHKVSHSNSSLLLSKPSKKKLPQAISASMSSSSLSLNTPLLRDSFHQESSISSSKLHQWVEESAQEIVKNLTKAPLLVQVFDSNGKTKFTTEKAVAEDWSIVKGKKSPDGLIYVEEIEAASANEDEEKKSFEEEEEEEEGVTKAWGIVVQGKGVETRPTCYLLKTNRVCAGFGLGICSTHFCLMRVQSFNKSALRQFEESWLLR